MKKNIVKYCIGFTILALVLYQCNITRLIAVSSSIRIEWLLPLIVLTPLAWLIRAVRLWYMLHIVKGYEITILQTLRLNLIGAALGFILPSDLGEMMKSFYGYDIIRDREGILGAVTMDKLFSLIGLFLMAVFGAWFSGLKEVFYIAVTLFFVSLVPITAVKVLPWKMIAALVRTIIRKPFCADRFMNTWKFRARYKIVLVLMSLLGWIYSFSVAYLIVFAVGFSADYFHFLSVLPVANFVKLIPVSIQGLGVQEATITAMFTSLGHNIDNIFVFSILYRLAGSIYPAIIGSFFVLTHKSRQE